MPGLIRLPFLLRGALKTSLSRTVTTHHVSPLLGFIAFFPLLSPLFDERWTVREWPDARHPLLPPALPRLLFSSRAIQLLARWAADVA